MPIPNAQVFPPIFVSEWAAEGHQISRKPVGGLAAFGIYTALAEGVAVAPDEVCGLAGPTNAVLGLATRGYLGATGTHGVSEFVFPTHQGALPFAGGEAIGIHPIDEIREVIAESTQLVTTGGRALVTGDGVGTPITFENGKLAKAATSGDRVWFEIVDSRAPSDTTAGVFCKRFRRVPVRLIP